MELSSEDSLRINVLLTQEVNAIRINESRMILHALLKDREVSIQLHPTGNDERYLKQVRELLSTHYLDSPAGFPVFMHRWNRMLQSGNEKLSALLKIGEPEAVIYAINCPQLTAAQAHLAWWAMPCTEVAIQLLQNHHVIASDLAYELRDFLLEFLPFETESSTVIKAVHHLVKNKVLTEEQQQNLWKKGQRKANYLIGFIQCEPTLIPHNSIAHSIFSPFDSFLIQIYDHPAREKLHFFLSEAGQSYLHTLKSALEKYTDQESIIEIFKAIELFLNKNPLPQIKYTEEMNGISPEISLMLESVIQLHFTKESDLDHILAQSTAVGSVLRKQLQPVTNPIIEAIEILLQSES